MTTFSKTTFDTAGYLAYRPTYPPRIYDVICSYHALHGGRFDHALDLGCGPGFIAVELASRFKAVTAIDPAQKMIDVGIQPSDQSLPRIRYQVGSAEDLAGAGVGEGEDGVDLIVAGQAAHWFDYPKVWNQLGRTVRKGGTVAFVGYAEMVFPDHPSLSRLIAHHSRSPLALGPYWQPGRSILDGLLDRVPFPTPPSPPPSLPPSIPNLYPSTNPPVPEHIDEPTLQPLADDLAIQNWDTTTAIRLKKHDDGSPWLLTKTFTLETLEGYLRSWSALHTYHESHPDDAARRGHGRNGDIVDRLVDDIREGLDREGQVNDDEILCGWPLVIMMIKKRQ